jgi:DNA-binding transcriptional LysR family regulator
MTITNIGLSQLHILAAVADEASFSGAAARLGMTQSGASQAISSLEAVLGVKLFVRGKNGVAPSAIGRGVLRDAREAVHAIERIQQSCSAAKGTLSGNLRIGCVPSAAARLLPQLFARYRRLHPGVKLSLVEGSDREVLQWVENGIIEIGLTSETSAETRAQLIMQDDFLLLTGRKHALAKRRHVGLRDIAQENFLMSGSGCEPSIRRIFASAKAAPNVVLTVRDTSALVEMVAQGLGVTMMPELAIPQNDRRLSRIPTMPAGRRRLFAVTRQSTPLSPALSAFAGLLLGRKRRSTQVKGAGWPRA